MPIDDFEHLDAKLKERLMLALRDAIVSEFDKGDWHEVAHLLGQQENVRGHKRLIRCLRWGDADYPAMVMEDLTQVVRRDPECVEILVSNQKIQTNLDQHHSTLLRDLGLPANLVSPPL